MAAILSNTLKQDIGDALLALEELGNVAMAIKKDARDAVPGVVAPRLG
jgi:hypothetical protein